MNIASSLIFMPLAMQGLLMILDEFYFHRKRGLPMWEVIGHPLDTLTVIAPLVYTIMRDFNDQTTNTYIVMSIVSCVFVIKDEWVHKDMCTTGEMLLHALLFVLHPLVFLSIFLLWKNGGGIVLGMTLEFRKIVLGQLAMSMAFLVHQIFYWGIINAANYKQRNIQRAR